MLGACWCRYLDYFFGSWSSSWVFLTPALPIGCILYYLKRNHIGQPTVYFPFFIIVPTAIFYITLAAQVRARRPRPSAPR